MSISDDEECAALVKLNGEANKIPSKKKETINTTTTTPTTAAAPYSIMDTAVKTCDTSFVLEPVREEQPRPNKLSRSRAPLNQAKTKDAKNLLMSLDAVTPPPPPPSLNGNEMSLKSETGIGATPSSTPSAATAAAASNTTILTLAPTTHYSHSITNDGNSMPLSRLDSLRTNSDASSSTKITMVQSAVTSFASNVNSIEPELVLSPAKLGQ